MDAFWYPRRPAGNDGDGAVSRPGRPGTALLMAQKLNLGDLAVSSSAFANHEPIPRRHAQEGDNVAPVVEWSGVPDATQAFALVVHDPDAPLVDGFTHWVTYGIPADARGLPEGGGGATDGVNSGGSTGYVGPAPPPGHGLHHYYFWIYALDEDLDLEPGLDRRALFERIEDHVIEQARLVGTYAREG
jgi:Raf kinase inhibitor-like YbhB/YbcL family protein